MSARATLRRLREAIGRATITIPWFASITIQFDHNEPRQESKLAKVAREGGEWWKHDERGQVEQGVAGTRISRRY